MSVDPSSHTSVIRSVATRVAGQLTTEAFAHHYGTPSQQIGVRAGDTLTYVTTGDAAAEIARAFTDALALAERQQLAWTASLTWLGIEPGTYPPTLLLRYGTPAASSVGYQPRREISGQIVPAHIWVRVGPVLWQICDRVAARRLAEVWTLCARLLTSPTATAEPFLRPDDVEPVQQRPAPGPTTDPIRPVSTKPPASTTRKALASADDEQEDRELLIAYAEHGDRAALAVLATRYHDVMVGAARRVLGARGEVDDAVQNAWIKVATKADTFRGDAAVGTWLYRIAHNAALDAARQAQRHPAELHDDPTQVASEEPGFLDDPSDALGTIEQIDARAVLDDLLTVLTPAQRAAVELVDLQGIDIATAAARLDVAEGTLKSRRARARAAMCAAAAQRGLRFPLLPTGWRPQDEDAAPEVAVHRSGRPRNPRPIASFQPVWAMTTSSHPTSRRPPRTARTTTPQRRDAATSHGSSPPPSTATRSPTRSSPTWLPGTRPPPPRSKPSPSPSSSAHTSGPVVGLKAAGPNGPPGRRRSRSRGAAQIPGRGPAEFAARPVTSHRRKYLTEDAKDVYERLGLDHPRPAGVSMPC